MRRLVIILLALCVLVGMVACEKAPEKRTYKVEIADNYPIANNLNSTYEAGETVTIQLETITEHYYVLRVNGAEQEMDREASDLTYTYFTFPMPEKDVVIEIEEQWVTIPPAPANPTVKSSTMILTIAETLPSCVAFEYREPNTPYCFYAFDEDEKLYRVLWTDWDGLKEKDRVIVEYEKLEKLTYAEYPDGGWTPQYELTATEVHTANCISKDQGAYLLTLPKSGQQIKLSYEEIRFAPYITDALVAEAENKVCDQVAQYDNSSGFYLQVNDDQLCLVQEVIHHFEPTETADGEIISGCGFDHEHLFFSEPISRSPVSTQSGTRDDSLWKDIANHFSEHLDMINFVPGLSQGDFIDQVGLYRYKGISVMAQGNSVNYDGPNGGGWLMNAEDIYSFQNDCYYTDTSVKYFNKMSTTVPLEGLVLPYDIHFEDTLVEAFRKIGIPMDPLADFVPDPKSDVAMTLYHDDSATILYKQFGNTQEPVDYQYPFEISYTQNYEINQTTTVQRTIILRYTYVTDCGLGEVVISVSEWDCLE